jgi:AbrB family looped-hinge helix DNA binding protein
MFTTYLIGPNRIIGAHSLTMLTSIVLSLYTSSMSVKVSPKFQVVIPENVRATLSIKVGSMVDVIAKGGIAYLVPVKSLSDIKKRIAGKLSATDQKTLRDKKDRDL